MKQDPEMERSSLKYQCGQCAKSFLISDDLILHHKSDHETKIACELCQNLFSSKNSLKYHLSMMHSEIRNQKCEYCEKTFRTKTGLTIHIQSIHEQKMSFKCEPCDMQFTIKAKHWTRQNGITQNPKKKGWGFHFLGEKVHFFLLLKRFFSRQMASSLTLLRRNVSGVAWMGADLGLSMSGNFRRLLLSTGVGLTALLPCCCDGSSSGMPPPK